MNKDVCIMKIVDKVHKRKRAKTEKEKKAKAKSATFCNVLSFLADRTAHSMIRYWRDNVVCLSVRLSVTLCTVAKRYTLQQK